MLQIWRVAKGYVAGAVAFVACPCHLPITLPLLIALTAGTAFGAWLEHNIVTAGLISTTVFIGGAVLAFKWIGESAVFSRDSSISQTSQTPPHSGQSEMPTVTLLTSSACASCRGARTTWQQALRQADFQFEEVDIISARGRELAAKHNIFSTPVTLVNGRVAGRGTPNLSEALALVQTKPGLTTPP
jgi:mercuric ion transport protein